MTFDPRDAGPFLTLGVDKDADDATIAAYYAARLAECERGETKLRPEDLDGAKDVLAEAASRVAADSDNLNADLASGELGRLTRLFHLDGSPPGWEPMDPEPPVTLPGVDDVDPHAVAAGLPAPDVPLDFPALNRWLHQFVAPDLDPWAPDLLG